MSGAIRGLAQDGVSLFNNTIGYSIATTDGQVARSDYGGIPGADEYINGEMSSAEQGGYFVGQVVMGATGLAKSVAQKTASQAASIPIVVDQRLSNIVDDLYKGVTNPNRFGNGTTMDAMKHELATGDKVFGRDHVKKGKESLRALQKWSAKPPEGSLASDRFVAEDLIGQLRTILELK